jgi:hypothetical protein
VTKMCTHKRPAVLRVRSVEKRTPSLPFTTNPVGRWQRNYDAKWDTSVVTWLLSSPNDAGRPQNG